VTLAPRRAWEMAGLASVSAGGWTARRVLPRPRRTGVRRDGHAARRRTAAVDLAAVRPGGAGCARGHTLGVALVRGARIERALPAGADPDHRRWPATASRRWTFNWRFEPSSGPLAGLSVSGEAAWQRNPAHRTCAPRAGAPRSPGASPTCAGCRPELVAALLLPATTRRTGAPAGTLSTRCSTTAHRRPGLPAAMARWRSTIRTCASTGCASTSCWARRDFRQRQRLERARRTRRQPGAVRAGGAPAARPGRHHRWSPASPRPGAVARALCRAHSTCSARASS